ncbi:hypothetical protein SAMN05518684_106224 [Salipaludibacillus aurantiacus]|uniref:Uncharacterized protein n=1 Tax=Salipaludibacillus aurantiacus TaxID=1601833 RepID=A0A1H9U0V5_9BACI|nr:hypothetical protein SAMN05518684_106224 [Salipaludibacillus aurantiacus]
MCKTCQDTGRQIELQGAIKIVRPCSDCTDDVRAERSRNAKAKLIKNLERMHRKLELLKEATG